AAGAGSNLPVKTYWRHAMFKKILIANRGARALGADAIAADCLPAGVAGQAGEFTPGARNV
ncbi:hypothetical protein ACVBEH_29225, partial [Roseateles sp. GG27B]